VISNERRSSQYETFKNSRDIRLNTDFLQDWVDVHPLGKAGRLEGKVAIVTGAASGIGREAALLFAHEGARVVVVDIVPSGGEETVRLIRESSGEAIFVNTDVTNENQIRTLVSKTVREYGGINVLFNDAGITTKPHSMKISELPEKEWDRVLNGNLKSVFLCSRNVFPVMKNGGGGSIINVSSIAVLKLSTDIAAYTVAKSGVITLTELLALDGAPHNIRVNCVLPSAIDTPMLRHAWTERFGEYKPVTTGSLAERIGKPEEVARTVLFLASDESSWISGTCIAVTGAYHIKP
jgi:NAD(P)-dependent dehydrogenase (short-subunit alcohol dehydrogenase family)